MGAPDQTRHWFTSACATEGAVQRRGRHVVLAGTLTQQPLWSRKSSDIQGVNPSWLAEVSCIGSAVFSQFGQLATRLSYGATKLSALSQSAWHPNIFALHWVPLYLQKKLGAILNSESAKCCSFLHIGYRPMLASTGPSNTLKNLSGAAKGHHF